ncbi:MAG: hypothetical protein EZS28_010414 [Streblomastix strix]|uniref:Mariner Mos1 transposase n=1 Tax=Streblomastix strix TaxID=222440 RepID=A0A5J4WGB8_9EUKA|nr:MAG: hypothetical protein EZS28_010414 [Streblomastix strix]
MLAAPKIQKQNDYRYLWTGYESYVFYCYRHNSQWVEGKQEPKQKPRRREHDPKVMLTVFWSAYGIQHQYLTTQGERMDAKTFTKDVLVPLDKRMKQLIGNQRVSAFIYYDNSSIHTAAYTANFCPQECINQVISYILLT